MEKSEHESDHRGDISSENESDNQMDISFSKRLYEHLSKNPQKYDKTFSVGKEKEIVTALGIILEIHSPSLDKLISGKSKEDVIELHDVDPKAFRALLKLLPSDKLSVEALSNLKLPTQELLSLISICDRFGIERIKQNLDIVAETTIFKNFAAFIQSDEFLDLSTQNLEAVLLNEGIWLEREILIFNGVCRWAEVQCSKLEIEITGKNIRSVLGNCLPLIRFPNMSNIEFATVVCPKNILSSQEELAIFKYISLEERNKAKFDTTSLNFNTRKRSTTMSFLRDLRLVNSPPFVCDAEDLDNDFQIDRQVTVYSVGFLGPVDSDGIYEVEVGIQRYDKASSILCGKVEKRIIAKKRKIFHIKFTEPITLDANRKTDNWDDYYSIWFTLRGANAQRAESDDGNKSQDFNLEADGVNFRCSWRSNQLAQLRFRRT